MLRHCFLPDAALGPEMLLWGGPADLRALAGWLNRFAAAPSPTPLTRAGACVAVDGKTILLAPSAGRLGLQAAGGAGSGFEWRLDAGAAGGHDPQDAQRRAKDAEPAHRALDDARRERDLWLDVRDRAVKLRIMPPEEAAQMPPP